MKKILYIDMDGVLADFDAGFAKLDKATQQKYDKNRDEVPDMFRTFPPIDGAVDAFHKLCQVYDVYILSTAPWNNPSAWSDKLGWVKQYLGDDAKKRLILTHHKNLNKGDYLIDDRTAHGADAFGEGHIQFGTEKYPNWEAVLKALGC